MPIATCSNALVMCAFGTAPCSLNVLPANNVMWVSMPAATIIDSLPGANIATFAMCSSIANPDVADATSKAAGVLTPMPCNPLTLAPWVPPVATVTIKGKPSVSQSCLAMCIWAGAVQQIFPGQTKVQLPM